MENWFTNQEETFFKGLEVFQIGSRYRVKIYIVFVVG